MKLKQNYITAVGLFIATSLVAQSESTMKNTNQNAPVKCSKSIAISASEAEVWRVLTDINTWSKWQSDISFATLNGPLQESSTFDWKTGGAKIHSTLHTVVSQKQFGWTGKTLGLFAIHNWTMSTHNGMVVVHVDESMEGWLAKLLAKSFNRNLESGMQTWLNLLKQECEKTTQQQSRPE